MSIIGTAESSSEHPLGAAVVKYVKKFFGVEVLGKCTNFEAISGFGLRATVNGLLKTPAVQSCLKEFYSEILVTQNAKFETKLNDILSKYFKTFQKIE